MMGYRFAPRACLRCGAEYAPTNNKQKYCVECHPIMVKVWKKNWCAANREYWPAWQLANPEKRTAIRNRWEGKHPEQLREIERKHEAQHRTLGFVPLNLRFSGAEAHHINQSETIYIPRAMHRAIRHNVFTGKNMAKINAIAYNFLFKQEVEAALEDKREQLA